MVFYAILSEFGPRRGRVPRGPVKFRERRWRVVCVGGARSGDSRRPADAVAARRDAGSRRRPRRGPDVDGVALVDFHTGGRPRKKGKSRGPLLGVLVDLDGTLNVVP